MTFIPLWLIKVWQSTEVDIQSYDIKNSDHDKINDLYS